MSRPVGPAASIRLFPDQWAWIDRMRAPLGLDRSGMVRKIVADYRAALTALTPEEKQ